VFLTKNPDQLKTLTSSYLCIPGGEVKLELRGLAVVYDRIYKLAPSPLKEKGSRCSEEWEEVCSYKVKPLYGAVCRRFKGTDMRGCVYNMHLFMYVVCT
jgi:hypothetical protein